MEEIRNFGEGINKDSTPLLQPEGTYRQALNMVQLSESGDLYAVINEKGTTERITVIPSGFQVMGYTILDQEVFVALANEDTGASQIGVVDYEGNYSRVCPSLNENEAEANANSELKLSTERPVDMSSRKRLGSKRMLYFCDGAGGRPLGFLDADNVPAIGEIEDNTKVIPNQKIPQIDLREIDESSGSLQVGGYQFVVRYYTQDLTPTSFSLVSSFVPIVDEPVSAGRDKYDGEYPDFGPVNKTIRLDVSNIDESFPFIELTAIYYSGITQTFTAEALPLQNIQGSEMILSYSGNEPDVFPLTREEINTIPISYSSAKAVVQKDNRIFWSNLADNSSLFDSELQRLFNDVTIEYVIDEIEYNPSSSESSNFNVPFQTEGLPYLANGQSSSAEFVIIDMTGDVSTSDSSDVNDYTLKEPETSAKVNIEFTDNFVVGDTITLTNSLGVQETYTAILGVPGVGEFSISSGNASTISGQFFNKLNAESVSFLASKVSSQSVFVEIQTVEVSSSANQATISYTGNGLVLTDATTGLPSNPINFAGGLDGATFNPLSVNFDPAFPRRVILEFDPSLFPLNLIPAGSLLDYEITAQDGDTFNGNNVVVASSATPDDVPESLGELNDYKSPFLTFYQKTYRRNEVYSFGGFVSYNDGSQSFNYHIPGNDKETTETTLAQPSSSTGVGPTFGLLGTYVSEQDYPADQNYPGNDVGDDSLCFSSGSSSFVSPSNRLVRHHKMPNLKQEPHFRLDESTGRTFIRLIGLRFKFNSPLSDSLKRSIQSISITREKRNINQNRSVFAQGVVTRHINVFNTYPYDWEPNNQGNQLKGPSNSVVKRMPLFDNFYLENAFQQEYRAANTTSLSNSFEPSIAFELRNPSEGWQQGESFDPSIVGMYASNERLGFFSPDSQLVDTNPSSLPGAKLRIVGRMNAELDTTRFKRSKNEVNVFNAVAAQNVDTSLRKYPQLFAFANYKSFDKGFYNNDLDSATTIESSQYIAKGETSTVLGLTDKIDNSQGPRYLYIKTTEGISQNPPTNIIKLKMLFERIYKNDLLNNDDEVDNLDSLSVPQSQMYNNLYNIETENKTQYGSPSGSEYVVCATTRDIPSSVGSVINRVYGGDTFISKYSYRNSDLIKMKGRTEAFLQVLATSTTTGFGYQDSNAIQHDGSIPSGINIKAIGYFFVESIVNVNYRHQAVNRTDPSNIQFEPPYYPKVDLNSALAVPQSNGDTRGYNPSYSTENDVRTYSNKLAAQVTIGGFPNRTIYSNRSLEDEVSDSYRIYDQNSFYDMPQNTGPIWDNFVYNNTLFLHTPKSLWRTYVNDVTNTATSVGEVVLGTGGLFTIPAKEMIVSTGGYAGSISQWAGVITPYGYYFPDVLQGKIFMLQGDQLREISQQGMQMYFTRNLKNGILNEDGTYNDNPRTRAGMNGAYDFELKRYLCIKTGTEFDETWSFSSLTEKWISEHNYYPDVAYSLNNRLFSVLNGPNTTFHEHNVGNYGEYYGEVNPCEMSIVFNKGAVEEKTWDNFDISSQSLDGVVTKQLDTFDSMRVYSETRNTGWYDVVVNNQYGARAVDDPTTQVRARRVNSSYHLTIPRDAVVDESLNIFEPSNQDPSGLFKPRIKGESIVLDLIYDNSDNYKLITTFIKAKFRRNPS